MALSDYCWDLEGFDEVRYDFGSGFTDFACGDCVLGTGIWRRKLPNSTPLEEEV